jgi:hypothetical protein
MAKPYIFASIALHFIFHGFSIFFKNRVHYSTSSIHAKFIGHKEKLRAVFKLATVDKNSYFCIVP